MAQSVRSAASRANPILVAGIDSSTQATKVVVRDAVSGALVREGRAPHPAGTEVDPAAWWAALQVVTRDGLFDGVSAMAVAAQQHGMVALDSANNVVRPALLWNDMRSAEAARSLVGELGARAWSEAVGSVPVASYTICKLRWMAEHEPKNADRTETVMLPHDYLTWRLRGVDAEPTTDRGDASGTGYWSPFSSEYRRDLTELAFGRTPRLPRVAGVRESVGEVSRGVVLAPGTGDNMAAALGVGVRHGDAVVSIGTSGTVFTVHQQPVSDETGSVSGFADATGHFLPLVCTINAAHVITAVAALLDVDLPRLDELALSAPPGAAGLVLIPYLEGERTPNRPHASGLLAGLRLANADPANLARAAVEGMICGLADGLDALCTQGIAVKRVLLIGGGARSRAVQAIAPALFDAEVVLPAASEYVADGAARQAAWVLSGEEEPPEWSAATGWDTLVAPSTPQVREAYAAVRDRPTSDGSAGQA